MNGGYINVDCTGIELTADSAKTITGMYARAEAARKTGKLCRACHCTFNGYEVTPIAVQVIKVDNGTIIATAEWIQVFITPEDSVTVLSVIQ